MRAQAWYNHTSFLRRRPDWKYRCKQTWIGRKKETYNTFLMPETENDSSKLRLLSSYRHGEQKNAGRRHPSWVQFWIVSVCYCDFYDQRGFYTRKKYRKNTFSIFFIGRVEILYGSCWSFPSKESCSMEPIETSALQPHRVWVIYYQ